MLIFADLDPNFFDFEIDFLVLISDFSENFRIEIGIKYSNPGNFNFRSN